MRGVHCSLAIAALVVVGCAGSAGKTAAPSGASASAAVAGPPRLTKGERMSYRVTLHDVTLATFGIAVGESTMLGDKKAIVVQAGAESAGMAALVKQVHSEFVTWLDAATGDSLLFRVTERSGGEDSPVEHNEARIGDYADGVFPVVTNTEEGKEIDEKQVAPRRPSDFIAFLIMLRSWEGKTGEHRQLDVVRSRYMWRTDITLAGRKTVGTDLGDLPAVRFDAVAQRLMRDGSIDKGTDARHFTVWVSDDADRVPLILVAQSEYGDIRMDIVDYTSPTNR